jgi:hypothetical protein
VSYPPSTYSTLKASLLPPPPILLLLLLLLPPPRRQSPFRAASARSHNPSPRRSATKPAISWCSGVARKAPPQAALRKRGIFSILPRRSAKHPVLPHERSKDKIERPWLLSSRSLPFAGNFLLSGIWKIR